MADVRGAEDSGFGFVELVEQHATDTDNDRDTRKSGTWTVILAQPGLIPVDELRFRVGDSVEEEGALVHEIGMYNRGRREREIMHAPDGSFVVTLGSDRQLGGDEAAEIGLQALVAVTELTRGGNLVQWQSGQRTEDIQIAAAAPAQG
jgi:hypothetical protein